MSKIIQLLPARSMLAVIQYRESFQEVAVKMFQLIESFELADNGKHTLKRYVTGVIAWQCQLCEAEKVSGFLGYANSEREAEYIGLKSMSEEQRERYRLARADSAPCSFTEMTRQFEARCARDLPKAKV